ncbi:hypothetical protein AVEN_253301-1 [Araneus ventricosus]|uniref:Uncharacterized protein n=1 Tax=Araneus ventricosus TaxID=182803 RepID=A0A4Y2LML3_ARAVE|nr:hypothetical protein AVEN_253301-1 [Araneus ventricosus]
MNSIFAFYQNSRSSHHHSEKDRRKKKRRLALKEVPSPKPNEPNQTNIHNSDTSAGTEDKEQIDVPNTAINETHERDQTPKKAKKIVANPMKWKCNARKIAHQTGKSYISERGKMCQNEERKR